MNDFLTRLAARQVEEATGLVPRLTSRFEPPPTASIEPVSEVPAPEIVDRYDQTRRARALLLPLDRQDDESHRVSDPATRAGPSRPRVPPLADVDDSILTPADLPARSSDRSSEERSLIGAAYARTVARPDQVLERRPPATAGKVAARSVRLVDHDSADVRHRPAASAYVVPRTLASSRVEFPVRGDAPPQATDEGPVVHVTIGRVEVRAERAPDPVSERRTDATPRAMSLNEYLERRHGERR